MKDCPQYVNQDILKYIYCYNTTFSFICILMFQNSGFNYIVNTFFISMTSEILNECIIMKYFVAPS